MASYTFLKKIIIKFSGVSEYQFKNKLYPALYKDQTFIGISCADSMALEI